MNNWHHYIKLFFLVGVRVINTHLNHFVEIVRNHNCQVLIHHLNISDLVVVLKRVDFEEKVFLQVEHELFHPITILETVNYEKVIGVVVGAAKFLTFRVIYDQWKILIVFQKIGSLLVV